MEDNTTITRDDNQLSVTFSAIDLLPVEVVGTILSYVSSAGDVARASAACCQWQEAARCHIHKLNFVDSDYKSLLKIAHYDAVVTEAVMQAEHLSDLSFSCPVDRFELEAAVVVALLGHTKRTLKSLTLLTPIKPRLNILEMLACYGCVLERLVWMPYSSGRNLRIHSIPSLLSLTLYKVDSLKYEDFCLLFTNFPMLEHLSLVDVQMEHYPSDVEIHASLKTLILEQLRPHFTNLVVHGSNLESLSLVNMRFDILSWGQTKGSVHVRNLSICSSTLEQLVLPGSLQSLVLSDTAISKLETCSLGSLVKLKLVERNKGLNLAWPIYSKVMSMASSRVKEVHVVGGFPGSDIVNVSMIASAFPCLHTLSVDFHNSFFGKMPQQLPLAFNGVVVLELHSFMQHNRYELLADWIVDMVSHCPSLKRLVLVLEGDDPGNQFISAVCPLLIKRMHAYPHVDVKLKFDGA